MADKLTGEALDKRVEELGIDPNLSADKKREEIEKIEAATAEGRAEAEALAADPSVQTFSVGELKARPRLVGRQYRGFQVAGAYHGVDDDTQVSLADAAERIDEWAAGEEAQH